VSVPRWTMLLWEVERTANEVARRLVLATLASEGR